MRNTQKYRDEELELFMAVRGEETHNFKAELFKLICKADLDNKSKLSLGYPEFVEIVSRYQNEEDYYDLLVERWETKPKKDESNE